MRFKCILLLVIIPTYFVSAQYIWGGGGTTSYKSTSFNDGTSYSKSQLWLGIKGGTNMSWADAGTKFQLFQPLPSSTNFNYEKTYEGIQFPGFQSGLSIIYNFRSFFSLVFEPSYSVQRFAYKNSFQWESSSPNSSVSLQQTNTYTLQYLEFPLFARVDISKNQWRPYVLAGGSYSYLTQAERSSVYESKDNVSGATDVIENPVEEMGVRTLFIRSCFWYAFGAGISYDINNIRVGLNALYKGGLNNITSEANRYSIQKISSTGDVLDNIKLRNIEISLYVVFPMKFITSPDFKRVNP